jgi:hypothetical protein
MQLLTKGLFENAFEWLKSAFNTKKTPLIKKIKSALRSIKFKNDQNTLLTKT